MVVNFEYQDNPGKVDIWTDTDFAGCNRTRKSTSGGIAIIGRHLVKSWCSTPAIVSLSSGEAEYYGIVKGGSIGLDIMSIMKDFGVDMAVRVNTDASAAKGIACRRGLGKVRHIEVNQLWLQYQVHSRQMTLTKIAGTDNCADILTKHASEKVLDGHLKRLDHRIREVRHVMMPSISLRGS